MKYNTPLDYKKEINLKKDKTLGYLVFYDMDHPLSDKNGKIYYHRHIASLKIGRWLEKEEFVHHVNEDRSDNRLENIEITTRSNHALIHQINRFEKLNKDGNVSRSKFITKICERCGIEFPGDRGEKFCSENCCRLSSRKFNLTKEQLKELVWMLPMTKIAEMLGVSDKAIKKRCISFGIETPRIGY